MLINQLINLKVPFNLDQELSKQPNNNSNDFRDSPNLETRIDNNNITTTNANEASENDAVIPLKTVNKKSTKKVSISDQSKMAVSQEHQNGDLIERYSLLVMNYINKIPNNPLTIFFFKSYIHPV